MVNWKNYKVFINYYLFRLGLRNVLPRDIIKAIKISDNNNPLVVIDNQSTLFFSDALIKPIYLRQEALSRLKTAEKLLPENFYFKIYDAYRTLDDQKTSWERRLKESRLLNPNADELEVERITRLKVANPFSEGYGGHQTGGAVDITLCDEYGNEYDLGTTIPEHNEKTKTNSKFLTKKEKSNRKILLEALTKAGFVNYPVEWWHFSFGDKMWAAYSRKKECIFGFIKP